ncbi:MAG: 6,7-dimethyl-8-ribityllumazine synthase [Phycisphaerae bacterium]|nr:6,7-dimethyl-8-ribityllumazine synthase [Phycisphaerae bacterium]
MGQEFAGKLVVQPAHRFVVLVSRFNSFISQQLLVGAKDVLIRHGASEEQIDVAWVPGSYELALTAKRLAAAGRYQAVIALGAIIRGQTPHFDHVASQTARGLAQVGLETMVPVVFGVITADNLEQAIDRAGTKAGNKGADAAMTAIEMINLFESLEK